VETPLPSLFVDGMNDDQIWEQLDLRAKKLCETLEEALEGTSKQLEDNEDDVPGGKDLRKVLIDGEAGLEELDGIDWDAEEGFDDDDEDEDEDSEAHDEDLGEDITEDLRDPSSEEDNEDGLMLFDLHGEKPKQSRRKAGGHSELDDGFFDLASFNAEADEGEAKSVSKGRLGVDKEDDSDSDMSVDLFAPVDDAENFEEEDLENADAGMNAGVCMIWKMLTIYNYSEPFYRDFFDPPPRMPTPKPGGKSKAKAPHSLPPTNMGKVRFHEEVQVRNIKAKGKNRPLSTMYDDDDDEDEDDDEEYGEQMTFDDFEAAMDGGGSEDDEEDEDGSSRDEDENEEGDGRDTIARLKDDLFADDEVPQTGSYGSRLVINLSLTLLFP
jgi:U3 small nucleolar RNA-associated protein MPP10